MQLNQRSNFKKAHFKRGQGFGGGVADAINIEHTRE